MIPATYLTCFSGIKTHSQREKTLVPQTKHGQLFIRLACFLNIIQKIHMHCSTFLVNLPSTSSSGISQAPPQQPQPPQQRISSEFFNRAMASALSANTGRNNWQVGWSSSEEEKSRISLPTDTEGAGQNVLDIR